MGWMAFILALLAAYFFLDYLAIKRRRLEEKRLQQSFEMLSDTKSLTNHRIKTPRVVKAKKSEQINKSANAPNVLNNPENDDAGYQQFVDHIWSMPNLPIRSIATQWVHGDAIDEFVIDNIAITNGRAIYINGYIEGVRKTLSGDGRHQILFRGQAVDASAYQAITRGVAPETAFAPRSRPHSVSEALLPSFRFGTPVGRQFVIGYANGRGEVGYRVVSGLEAGDEEGFTATCHFRWGTTRSFAYARVIQVVDVDTGEELNISDLKAAVRPQYQKGILRTSLRS